MTQLTINNTTKIVYKDKKNDIISIYLTSEIGSLERYIKAIRALDAAKETTTVNIFIGSYGGELDTTIALVEHINNCKGTVVGYVSFAASAATIIALACPKIYLHSNGWFMIHNFSSVSEGKGLELKLKAEFEDKWTQKIFKDIYKGFLSEEEIADVIEDKDLWLLADVVIERLERIGKHYVPNNK